MPYISKEFGFTASQEGLIVSAFQLRYVIIVLITGWLADKVGAKNVVACATLLTAVFAMAFVFVAVDFKTILLMRLLTGLSAGAIYVPGMSLLAGWFPAEERGKAIAFDEQNIISVKGKESIHVRNIFRCQLEKT